MGDKRPHRLADSRPNFHGSELVALGCGVGKSRLQGHRARPARTWRQSSGRGLPPRLLCGHLLALGREWEVVVGHSLGGAIAAIAQTENRTFAGRLVLEDPVLRLSDPVSFIAEYTRPFEDPSAAAVLAENPRWHPQDARIKEEALEASSPEVVRRTTWRTSRGIWFPRRWTSIPHAGHRRRSRQGRVGSR